MEADLRQLYAQAMLSDGPDHPDTVQAAYSLVNCLLGLGTLAKLDEGIALLMTELGAAHSCGDRRRQVNALQILQACHNRAMQLGEP